LSKLAEHLEPTNPRTDKVLDLYNSLDGEDKAVMKAALLNTAAYTGAGLARSLNRAFKTDLIGTQVSYLRRKLQEGKVQL
jgi:hypothetical protein